MFGPVIVVVITIFVIKLVRKIICIGMEKKNPNNLNYYNFNYDEIIIS